MSILTEVLTLSHSHTRTKDVHCHCKVVLVGEVGGVDERDVKGITRRQTNGTSTSRSVYGVKDVKVTLIIEDGCVVLSPLLCIVHPWNGRHHLVVNLISECGHNAIRPSGIVIDSGRVVRQHDRKLRYGSSVVDVVVVQILHRHDAVNVARVLNVTGIVH